MNRVKNLTKLEGGSAAGRLVNLRKRTSQQVIRPAVCNQSLQEDIEGPFSVDPNLDMFGMLQADSKDHESQRVVSTKLANSKIISKDRTPMNEQADAVVTASPVVSKRANLNLRRMTPVPGFHPFKTSGKLLNRNVKQVPYMPSYSTPMEAISSADHR